MTDKDYTWLKHYPPKPDWHAEIPDRNIIEVLAETVKRKGDSRAMDFMGKTYSWAEIGAQVDRFAKGLKDMGIGKGDKVGLFLPNCPTFFIAYYGIMKAGATVVNYNPLYAHGELQHQIEDSETDTMITLDLGATYPKALSLLEDPNSRLKRIITGKFTDILPFPKNWLAPIVKSGDFAKPVYSDKVLKLSDVMQNNGKIEMPDINTKEDVAVLQYTGGTTGTPKGAMLTHRNIFANAYQAYMNFPEDEEHQKMLAVLPFFHVFAMTVTLNVSVLGGFEILTIPRFDLKQTMDLLHKKRPDYMPAVPAIFNAINNHPKIKDYDLSSLRFCISGGAPLPVEVKKAFEQKTKCTVVEGYGLTEASPVTHVNPPFGKNIAGSIGLPIPGTIVEIIDKDDKKTPVKQGERGEVCIRGPQVMKGYWNNVAATDDVLRKTEDGDYRLHTGDIGIMDENGYTYIVDRIKDMIITNGYNVYPRNIEEAIYEFAGVEECIVAGLPDQQRGEIVKAWIKPKDGQSINEDELRKFLEERLSKMEMPRRIEIRNEPLPKTMIGKLSRKDMVAEEMKKTKDTGTDEPAAPAP